MRPSCFASLFVAVLFAFVAPATVLAQSEVAAHRAVAIERADSFYRFEFKIGSEAIRVESVKIETKAPEPVAGWSGRYRTRGTVHLLVFDTKGWSSNRATSTFEVVTERKSDGSIEAIDFTRKT